MKRIPPAFAVAFAVLVAGAAVAVVLAWTSAFDRVFDEGGPAAVSAAGDPLQVAVGPAEGLGPLLLHPAAPGRQVVVPFHQPPSAGMLFDLDTGEILWERNPRRRLPIASVTKMMTALVTVESEPPDARVLITKAALNYSGSGIGELRLHSRVKLETMLNGLLLPSGNDAAIALALHVAGSQRAFVERMNARAAQLGMTCTHYSTPSGIRDEENHSCAADLAQLARAVLDQPRLARIVRRRDVNLPFPIKGGRLWLHNHNPLLQMRYPGTIGIKTGYTEAAGMCLVAAAQRGGQRLGVVLLHSPNTGDQARKLLERGFKALRGD